MEITGIFTLGARLGSLKQGKSYRSPDQTKVSKGTLKKYGDLDYFWPLPPPHTHKDLCEMVVEPPFASS